MRHDSVTAPRIDWVDAGRGLAIILVVLYHATNWLSEAGIDTDGWHTVNETIASIRLPLFFTMAGLFAQKWAMASWSTLWTGKVSLFVWVYLLWSVIATLTFMLGLNMQGAEGNYLAQFRDLLVAPILPRFELWFIWALALFFILVKVIRRIPVVAQLVFAGALSAVLLSDVIGGNAGWLGSGKYFFFFLIGLHGRSRLLAWSGRARPPALIGIFLAWVALVAAGTVFGWRLVPGFYFACCMVGVAAGIAVSRALTPIPGIRYLGARTLPIYLTHTSLILVMTWLLWRLAASSEGVILGWVLAPLLAAIAITVSLLLARVVAKGAVLRYLYEQPPWFAHSVR